MNLWVLGGSGVLGSHVIAVAEERSHHIFAPDHESCPIQSRSAVAELLAIVKKNSIHIPDVIINCAGAIPGANIHEMVMTNGFGPHNLASLGIRLIHMSTDCVFADNELKWQAPFRSEYLPDATSLYGRSKMLGEPEGDHVLVVRGSFIDPAGGFLNWLLNTRKSIDAWMKAYWNGTSARRMAEHLLDLVEGTRTGICHVAAREHVNKAWMVEYFANELDLRLDINLVHEPYIWRVLEPDVETIPIHQMCDELIAQINGGRE